MSADWPSSPFSSLQPWLVPWADALYSAWPYAQVTSVRRTFSQQTRLWNAFLRGESRYPAAPPGTSKHEFGLAWDMVAEPAILAALGELWESWGGTWGGRFGDPIHFEA
jgi:hypothetical protein